VNPSVEQALATVHAEQNWRAFGRILLAEIDRALPGDVAAKLVNELVEAGLPGVAAAVVALGSEVQRARARLAKEED
jgi:hypothetical protein